MIIEISKKIFNPIFLPLLEDNEHDVIFLLGGGASGKSYFSFQRCIYRCLIDKRKYLVVRNSAVDLKRSCWEDLLSAIDCFHLNQLVKINKTDKTITFPNSSCILCMGLDDDSKIKSIPNITDIICEECSEISLDKFSQLKQRLRGHGEKLKNQIVLMSNPVSKANWTYKHFFEYGNKEPNSIISRSTYKDNPFCNEATISALENYKTTNPYFYSVYCLGKFGTLGKRIYTNYSIINSIEHNMVQELIKNKYKLAVGLDFGFITSLTAIVCSLVNTNDKKIYIFKEFGSTGLTNDEIANKLKSLNLSKEIIIADSADPKSIEEIKREGIAYIKPSKKGPDSVRHGISYLQEFEIIVDSSCTGVIQDLENYCYKKDKRTNEYYNEPDKESYDAHYLDALRYSICLQPAQLKTTSYKLV